MNPREPKARPLGPGWAWLSRSDLVWYQLRAWALLTMGLRVRGRANIREEEPAVYVGNHASHYDLFIMLASLPAFQRGKLVVASWHRILEMRLLGPLLRGIDTVPVDPRTGSDAQRTLALRQLVNHVRQGRSVMIFPEGRRNDRLGEFGTGAALVAHQCGVPVAPFAIRGAQPLFKSVGWPDRWFGEVDVEFLPRFDPASVTAGMAGAPLEEKLAALTHEMRRRVAGAVDYPVDGPA